ncbi:tRNA adenosine(34) deaminase TadA [Rickettsiella grylli]|uniref:tRNA-specific adenosine deaminase n=1 Tax=Rickettsiella grylli TaxID=59196 RepID=A8PMP8_9COXI|nr:tRNA adenosine(34) deaminase TadA [Rickettsiella grylli]EDP45770.1 tRNA-specific adenosine deaminase [Rickettsiella grylli]
MLSNRIAVSQRDTAYMQLALNQAAHAKRSHEVPIGAILVWNDHVIATAYNQTLTRCDPTAHAEIVVLQETAKQLKNHRLLDATLYVTLEPCLMCVGAMIQARIKRLVFGAYDARLGTIMHQLHRLKGLNHSFEVAEGVLSEACSKELKQFFKYKRCRHGA